MSSLSVAAINYCRNYHWNWASGQYVLTAADGSIKDVSATAKSGYVLSSDRYFAKLTSEGGRIFKSQRDIEAEAAAAGYSNDKGITPSTMDPVLLAMARARRSG